MKARKLTLSAYYISKVEYDLFRGRTFGNYADNVKQLPSGERSMVIRSGFPSGGVGRPAQSVPGYYSSSIVRSFPKMLEDIEAGKYRSYLDRIVASGRSVFRKSISEFLSAKKAGTPLRGVREFTELVSFGRTATESRPYLLRPAARLI